MQIDTIIEPFAGLGAYSLKAMAMEADRMTGRRCRHEPPVSRTGNKAGFVPNVFKAFGLNRTRWKAVWLNDASAVCHLFHLMYSSHELRVEVSRRIWAMVPCPVCLPDVIGEALRGERKPTPEWLKDFGKAGCQTCNGTGVQDARQLWERIRKELVQWPTTFAELALLIALAMYMQSRSFSLTPVEIVGGAWNRSSYKKEVDDLPRAPTSHAAGDDSPRWTVAGRVEALPGRWETHGMSEEFREGKFTPDQGSRSMISTRSESLPISHLSIRATWGDASLVLPEGDASNVLCVLDPPYQNTSGYQADCPREVVLTLARAWHEAGALVLLHEACGLARELGQGWLERPIDTLRGRASTFWSEGGQREWLTFNRPVVWWPEEQRSLF